MGYPWDFRSDSRDFIIASWSINKDFLGGEEDIDKRVANRMSEFKRILKPNGIIFVRGGEFSPRTHYDLIKSYLDIENAKNFELIHF